jgi:hypothetical protein
VPVTQAGLLIFARNGIVLAVEIRERQLSGAVRLIEVQSDMCGVEEYTPNDDATFRNVAPTGTSGIRDVVFGRLQVGCERARLPKGTQLSSEGSWRLFLI